MLSLAMLIATWDYDQAYDAALRSNSPLLVFVRQPALHVQGCMSVRVEHLAHQEVPGVVIGLPDGQGGFERAASRDGCPTASYLAKRVADLQKQREVQRFPHVATRSASKARS